MKARELKQEIKIATAHLRLLVRIAALRIGNRLVDYVLAKESHIFDDAVLYRVLHKRTGKLRVSDAFLICGVDLNDEVDLDLIGDVDYTIRCLGWKREYKRFFSGSIECAYVKGSAEQRKVELVVEYDTHARAACVEPAMN